MRERMSCFFSSYILKAVFWYLCAHFRIHASTITQTYNNNNNSNKESMRSWQSVYKVWEIWLRHKDKAVPGRGYDEKLTLPLSPFEPWTLTSRESCHFHGLIFLPSSLRRSCHLRTALTCFLTCWRKEKRMRERKGDNEKERKWNHLAILGTEPMTLESLCALFKQWC